MYIVNRWRQFSRRYFWSHFLLGIVAVSIGAPLSVNGLSQHVFLATPSIYHNHSHSLIPGIGQFILPADINNAGLQHLNPWQQFALRHYLTRLVVSVSKKDLTFATRLFSENSQIAQSHHALLDSLSIQSDIGIKLLISLFSITFTLLLIIVHPVRTWLSVVQGIRAGPFSLT